MGSGATGEEFDALRAQVRELQAREQIRECLYGYARALDRLDRTLLEAQFWPDAEVEYGAFYCGPVPGFFEVALRFRGAMRDTQHLIGNVHIVLAGASARVESYVQAQHVLLEHGELVQLTVGARYLDRFEKRDSSWRITWRTEVMDWGRRLTISENWFEEATSLPKGQRGAADLSYRYLGLPA